MFWRKRARVEKSGDTQQPQAQSEAPRKPAVDFLVTPTDEERDVVSIIASAIMSTHAADSNVRVRSVKRVDTDKRDAAIIAAAVVAHDQPDSIFKLVSIEEKENTHA